MKLREKLKIVASVLLAGIVLFLGIRVIEERILLKRYIEEVEQAKNISQPYSSNDIFKIRDYILSDIDFKSSDIAPSRPKIGWTVRTILKKRQGLCGEGSRLLFHILRHDKIKSRRIYLHGNSTLHVAIEYYDQSDEWVLNWPPNKSDIIINKN
ncbi:MAG: transglutaminase domain-containing protein [Bacteroidota bacterium]